MAEKSSCDRYQQHRLHVGSLIYLFRITSSFTNRIVDSACCAVIVRIPYVPTFADPDFLCKKPLPLPLSPCFAYSTPSSLRKHLSLIKHRRYL